VHLQCHFGQDTLSWGRLGAEVTGLDFSEAAMEAARALAAEIGVEADFVCADVYDAAEALGGRRFDIVYTGFGALNWLSDLPRWADVVASLLEPGGFLYLAEFHPFQWIFGDDDLTIEIDYFQTDPHTWDDPGTYGADATDTKHNRTIEWQHPLGEIVSSVIGAGLTVEFLHEHDWTLMERWPFLEKHGVGEFRMPEGQPRLPLMFTLRARRAA
jgi:SAM-dependent methyltransferase